jgi:hypothetical protein
MNEETRTAAQDPEMDAADVFDNPEPWSKEESRLVLWSFAAAFVSLVIFGLLVNKFILHAF